MGTTLGQLSQDALGAKLESRLGVEVGPFTVALRSNDTRLAWQLHDVYPDYRLAPDDAFAHVVVTVRAPARFNPLARSGKVVLDDGADFSDYPAGDALPYLEWAINWCIATRCHFYLMLHAAVVEKHGCALLMPGLPGAGKSTLCAYLVHNGWRHLSDEFCLLRPGTLDIDPFPRLIPLKNESIDVIRGEVPGVRIGPRFEGTRKGTVAHVAPPDAHVRDGAPARASLVVLPTFESGAGAAATAVSRGQCFVELSKNAFNYQVLGRAGFETVAALVERAPCFRLSYGRLADAAGELERLAARHFH